MSCGRSAGRRRAHTRGYAAGHVWLAELAPSTVYEVLNGPPAKPHKLSYYPERRYPALEERRRRFWKSAPRGDAAADAEGRPSGCCAFLR